jgi:hypothetical protein
VQISGNLIVNILIICLVLWLIFTYLIPLLPAPFGMIVMIVCVVLLIVWLLRVAGLVS